uniref:Uncharacterized protein n=1 Tax=viral metagenome TaxID=1070528 RepID=A0A6C0H4Q4_9ZZZZ
MNPVKINNEFYYCINEIKGFDKKSENIVYAKKIGGIWIESKKEKNCKKFVKWINNSSEKMSDISCEYYKEKSIRIKGELKENGIYFNVQDILSQFFNVNIENVLLKTEYGIDSIYVDDNYFINYQNLLKLFINSGELLDIIKWVSLLCNNNRFIKNDVGLYLYKRENDYVCNIKENNNLLYFVKISDIFLLDAKKELDDYLQTTEKTIDKIYDKMDEIGQKYLDMKIKKEMEYIKKINELEIENMKLQLKMIKFKINN